MPDKRLLTLLLLSIHLFSISYYDAGVRGQIPPFLCDTLQFFAYYPCQCEPKPGQATEKDLYPSPTAAPAIQKRRPVTVEEGKEAFKLSHNRGGAGGGQVHQGRRDRRRLKGSS